MSKMKWTEEAVETLVSIVGGDVSAEVSPEQQEQAAEVLGTTVRSVAAKLRNMGYENVASTAAAAKGKAYTEAEEEELRAFVESNPGQFTFAEIAENVLGGTRNARQIQGKLLSMELTDKVKPTPKQEVAKKYTEAEEQQIIDMMKSGAFLEEIAEALNREINSIRGKCLSIVSKSEGEFSMPKQKESHAKASASDPFADIDVSQYTVSDLVEMTGKTERGIKTMLTRRGISAADYDGAKKAAKAQEKREAAA